MESVQNAISWFEIPVTDLPRAKKFFETILNIEMPEMDMGELKMAIFNSDAEKGGVGGALCLGEGYEPSGSKGPKAYLNGGNDLSTVLNRVADAGGTVVLPKTMIAPDMGYMAFFQDTEGNVLGLYSMN